MRLPALGGSDCIPDLAPRVALEENAPSGSQGRLGDNPELLSS